MYGVLPDSLHFIIVPLIFLNVSTTDPNPLITHVVKSHQTHVVKSYANPC